MKCFQEPLKTSPSGKLISAPLSLPSPSPSLQLRTHLCILVPLNNLQHTDTAPTYMPSHMFVHNSGTSRSQKV